VPEELIKSVRQCVCCSSGLAWCGWDSAIWAAATDAGWSLVFPAERDTPGVCWHLTVHQGSAVTLSHVLMPSYTVCQWSHVPAHAETLVSCWCHLSADVFSSSLFSEHWRCVILELWGVDWNL